MARNGGGRRRSASQARNRKWPSCSLSRLFFIVFAICIVSYIVLDFHLESLNLTSLLPRIKNERPRTLGIALRFMPSDLVRRLKERGGIERLRSEQHRNSSIRRPRLALVVDKMSKDPQNLMLLTLVKGLTKLGYIVKVFALQNGDAHSLWKHSGCPVSILSPSGSFVDWSNYEGVILSSLEVHPIMSSLMQDPFCSVPIIWLIQEDTLGKRLSSYEANGWQHLITMWRTAFSRADVVVFPDLILPMLYTSLDTGNFYVISGSPMDVWVAKSSNISHLRHKTRRDYGFNEDELIVVVIGSYFFYDDWPWDYSAVMSALSTSMKNLSIRIKFVFLCGNSTEPHRSDFQELASRMGFPGSFMSLYAVDGDLNSLLLMADIALYGSFQEEQSFPPLLVRAMSFQIPTIVPDLAIIKKYVSEDFNVIMFKRSQPESLATAFSFLVEVGKISSLGRAIASNGKWISRNMFASECIADYGKLLEHALQFPSDVVLPDPISRGQKMSWLWDLYIERETSTRVHNFTYDSIVQGPSIVDMLEEEHVKGTHITGTTRGENGSFTDDTILTEVDWNDFSKMEISENIVRREIQELDERNKGSVGIWDIIRNNIKKAEKQAVEKYERDESDLVRSGWSLCIYEIYNGKGSWPFLHRSPLYRGINLSKGAPISSPDDVDAVRRLPILNETHYKDLLCEIGAMFSVAYKVDSIHNLPWIGFQSWRATGRQFSLSRRAEKELEATIQAKTKGNVIFYWAPMEFGLKHDFWSMCDVLNAGYCRSLFEDAFRRMFGLPDNVAALPPMPADGGKWSTLHSWVMPTDSFVEFMMFSRMFVDSLHTSNLNISRTTCVLGSTPLEALGSSKSSTLSRDGGAVCG